MCRRGVRCVLRTRISWASRSASGKGRAQLRAEIELEIRKRREDVEQAKNTSTCKACGRKGRWSGDPVLPTLCWQSRSVQGSWSAIWSTEVTKTDKQVKTLLSERK